jgi:hypothetical protein
MTTQQLLRQIYAIASGEEQVADSDTEGLAVIAKLVQDYILEQGLLLPEEFGGEPVNDIWKDPQVKEALKNGRDATDIAVLPCPKCNRYGYYNHGSHFSCRFCKITWYVLSEAEIHHKSRHTMTADDLCTLADTVTETTVGYDNETRPAA